MQYDDIDRVLRLELEVHLRLRRRPQLECVVGAPPEQRGRYALGWRSEGQGPRCRENEQSRSR